MESRASAADTRKFACRTTRITRPALAADRLEFLADETHRRVLVKVAATADPASEQLADRPRATRARRSLPPSRAPRQLAHAASPPLQRPARRSLLRARASSDRTRGVSRLCDSPATSNSQFLTDGSTQSSTGGSSSSRPSHPAGSARGPYHSPGKRHRAGGSRHARRRPPASAPALAHPGRRVIDEGLPAALAGRPTPAPRASPPRSPAADTEPCPRRSRRASPRPSGRRAARSGSCSDAAPGPSARRRAHAPASLRGLRQRLASRACAWEGTCGTSRSSQRGAPKGRNRTASTATRAPLRGMTARSRRRLSTRRSVDATYRIRPARHPRPGDLGDEKRRDRDDGHGDRQLQLHVARDGAQPGGARRPLRGANAAISRRLLCARTSTGTSSEALRSRSRP